MNKQNNVTIQTLRDQLVSELKEHNYTRGTIQLYTEHVNQILQYMAANNIKVYTGQIADEFYREVVELRNYSERTRRFYRTVIRRLNDLYLGNGFVVSVPRKDLTLPESFRPVAAAYLDYCGKNGNSPITLKAKERALHFFVTGLEQLGCRSFSELTARFVSNASILIKNKEFYPELRDFMRYLNVSGHTDLDFSTLIPKYRRGFRIPSTYTAEEISKVEQSVDTSVPPGKRDLAIILLASRLGIRAGDIAAMKFSNLDFDHDRICFVQRKTDLYIPYIFDSDELYGIMTCADEAAFINKHNDAPYIDIEMAMLIRLLYCCGLRLGEALSLQVKHIDFRDGIISVIHAKNDKQRLVPVHDSVKELLNRYCAALGMHGYPEAFIFPGRFAGTKLSQSTAQRRFKSILMHQGIIKGNEDVHKRGPCLHCLRHCFMLSAFKQLGGSGYAVDLAAPYLFSILRP